jgi:NAD(P)-dependent dehydrogenase (short-subunit alcohol dehydrogenase family)
MLESSDVTGAILYLLSDDSRYVVGQNLIVDDGFSN